MIDTQRPQNVVVTSAKHRHMSCSVSVWILVANRRTGDGRTLIGEECGVQAQVRVDIGIQLPPFQAGSVASKVSEP